MGSVTLNGRVYNDADFLGYGYVSLFPAQIFADLLAEIQNAGFQSPAQAAAAGAIRQVVGRMVDGSWDADTQAKIDSLLAEGWPDWAIWVNVVTNEGPVNNAGYGNVSAVSVTASTGTIGGVGVSAGQGAGSISGVSVATSVAGITGTGIAVGSAALTGVSATTSVAGITGTGAGGSAGAGALTGVSAATSVAEISGAGETAIPAQVTGVNAINSPAQLTVNWTAVANATSYNVYYSISNNSVGATKISGATTGTSFTINGPLTQGTTYYVWVSAQNSGGEGPLSISASAAAGAAWLPWATSTDGWADPGGHIVIYQTGGPNGTDWYVHSVSMLDENLDGSSDGIMKAGLSLTVGKVLSMKARGNFVPCLSLNGFTIPKVTTGPGISTTVWQTYSFTLDANYTDLFIGTAAGGDGDYWTDISEITLT